MTISRIYNLTVGGSGQKNKKIITRVGCQQKNLDYECGSDEMLVLKYSSSSLFFKNISVDTGERVL